MVWSLKTLLFTLQIANSQPRGVRPHVRTFPLWMLKRGWYIFIFLDGCALFPQYCRWTKTAASRQVNMEVPESAVCSRQGLQQFITERQYKARPVWLQLVNYNKSLGVFSFILGYRGQGVGIPQTFGLVLYSGLFSHFKSFLSCTHLHR